MGGNYLDFSIHREEAVRYALTVGDVQDAIQSAVGGMNMTTKAEGLERYPVNLSYSREFRDNLRALRNILVATSRGQQIPLGYLADVDIVKGPAFDQDGELPPAACTPGDCPGPPTHTGKTFSCSP